MGMIYREWQYVFECDSCRRTDSIAYKRREKSIKEFRRLGWSINGKRVICPDCKDERKNDRR